MGRTAVFRASPPPATSCCPPGVKDLQVLKTTQSGYEGFLRDQYTMLPESNDRILATSITSTWKYSTQPPCYDAAFHTARQAIIELCFGAPKGGVYSPSVQYTIYQMGSAVLERVPQVRRAGERALCG